MQERSLSAPEKVVELMNTIFDLWQQAEEYVYLVCLNKNNSKGLGVFEVSHGTNDKSILGMREIFIRVLLADASNMILVHNHPSASIFPSKEDRLVTKRVRDCARLLNVSFLEHIIIGGEQYFSFREDESLG